MTPNARWFIVYVFEFLAVNSLSLSSWVLRDYVTERLIIAYYFL